MAGGEDSTGAATPGGPDCPTGNTSCFTALLSSLCVNAITLSDLLCVCVQEKDAESRALTEEWQDKRTALQNQVGPTLTDTCSNSSSKQPLSLSPSPPPV